MPKRSWISLIAGKSTPVGSPLRQMFLIPPYSIILAPPFPGIRRFKDGRRFNQWTGNDSKALMKVTAQFANSPLLLSHFLVGMDVRH